MIKQYTESYGSISADIQNIVANDISLGENYILMQTGQYEWTALIRKIGLNEVRQIVITRSSSSGYNNLYDVTRNDYNKEFGATISNEYYVYSDMGYGKSLDLPVYEGVTSWCLMIICCILMFAVVFKGALFKCLDKRKRLL